MSKLSDTLYASKTNHLTPKVDISVLELEENTETVSGSFERYIEYRLLAKFQAFFQISTLQLELNPGLLTEVERQTKQKIVEEIFGEFRFPLIKLRNAIHNNNTQVALEVLEDIYKDMFEVDRQPT